MDLISYYAVVFSLIASLAGSILLTTALYRTWRYKWWRDKLKKKPGSSADWSDANKIRAIAFLFDPDSSNENRKHLANEFSNLSYTCADAITSDLLRIADDIEKRDDLGTYH